MALGLGGLACGLPLLDAYTGSGWYLDSPLMVLGAALAGYLVGASAPARATVGWVAAGAVVLSLANGHGADGYPFLDDLIFFAVVLGAPALAGAVVVARAAQVRQLARLQAELLEQHRLEAAAARLERLRTGERERARLLDLLEYQVGEIRAAAPQLGEEDPLSAQLSRLTHQEAIAGAAAGTLDLLSDGRCEIALGAGAFGESTGDDGQVGVAAARGRVHRAVPGTHLVTVEARRFARRRSDPAPGSTP